MPEWKYEQFFRQRIPDMPAPNERGEVVVKCVFHSDSSPSLGVSLDSGKWKCFTPTCPGSRGGGYKKFDQLLNGETPPGTTTVEVRPIEPSIVDGFHHVLLQSPKMLSLLQNKRGLSMETILKFKLGFDGDRVHIPIRDSLGEVVNVRKYKPGATRDKMVPYAPGYNRARLFPLTNLTGDWCLLCEGEMDCLVACQYGYPAITTTGGSGTWLQEFSEALRGKKVVICYDTDKSGKDGAQAIAMRLVGVCSEVRVLTLPLVGSKEEKDLTNFFVDLGHTREDFDALIESATLVQTVATTEQPTPMDEVVPIHLAEVGEDRFVGRRIQTRVLVAGKDLAPFQVPFKVSYQCEMGQKVCEFCGICREGGQTKRTIPEWDPNLIAMANVHKVAVERVIADLVKVPGDCRRFKFTVDEFANLELVKLIPEIDFNSDRAEYVIRNFYFLGHGLETNHTYVIKAVVMPDPKTQYATGVIYDAMSSQDSLEKFELDTDTLTQLSVFKVRA